MAKTSQVLLGGMMNLLLFALRDGFLRRAKNIRDSGFHFHKMNRSAPLGNNVDFRVIHAEIALQNATAILAQVSHCYLLAYYA